MSPLLVARDAILEIETDLCAQLVRDGSCEWNYGDLVVEYSERCRP